MEYIIFGVAKAIAVLPAIFWLTKHFGMPRTFWVDERLHAYEDREGLAKWKLYGGVIIVFGGIMLIAYEATDVLLDWIPRSWGDIDEEGEWRPIQSGLQATIAFFVAHYIMDSTGKRGEAIAKRPTDAAFVDALIDELETKPRTIDGKEESAQEYRQRLVIRGRASMNGVEKSDDSYGLKRYRGWLMKRLTDVEKQINEPDK